MAEGTIKRLTDKGFGFIVAGDGTEYFFHNSACTQTHFDDLREGQTVTFDLGEGAWLLKSVHMVEAPRDSGVMWESLWASLTLQR